MRTPVERLWRPERSDNDTRLTGIAPELLEASRSPACSLVRRVLGLAAGGDPARLLPVPEPPAPRPASRPDAGKFGRPQARPPVDGRSPAQRWRGSHSHWEIALGRETSADSGRLADPRVDAATLAPRDDRVPRRSDAYGQPLPKSPASQPAHRL